MGIRKEKKGVRGCVCVEGGGGLGRKLSRDCGRVNSVFLFITRYQRNDHTHSINSIKKHLTLVYAFISKPMMKCRPY